MNRYVPAATTDPEAGDEPKADQSIDGLVIEDGPTRLGGVVRVLLGLAGSLLIGLLGIAAMLNPNPDGMGTHRQIRLPWTAASEGLPACSFLVQFGRPCPSCGMTTSWAYLMDGNVIASFRTNVAGMWLGLLALVSGPWMVVSAWRGSWFLGRLSDGMILALGVGTIILTLGHWVFRLWVG